MRPEDRAAIIFVGVCLLVAALFLLVWGPKDEKKENVKSAAMLFGGALAVAIVAAVAIFAESSASSQVDVG